MFIASHHNLLIILFLSITICLSSVSTSNDGQEDDHSLRERRQTLPALIDTLKPLVVSLLATVSALLANLALGLPIILGALGLGGLGLSLGIIVAQLSIIVLSLAGRKRRAVINLPAFPAVTSSNIIQTVNDTQSAVVKIQNLRGTQVKNLDITVQLKKTVTDLTTFRLTLNSASATATQIKNDFIKIVTGLTSALNQAESAINTILKTVQNNVVSIDKGLALPLIYIAGLTPSLTTVVPGIQLSAVTLTLQNIAIAQNATLINFSNLDNTLFSISYAINSLLRSIATQFGNVIGVALVSCRPQG